jgi:hypothetical protein
MMPVTCGQVRRAPRIQNSSPLNNPALERIMTAECCSIGYGIGYQYDGRLGPEEYAHGIAAGNQLWTLRAADLAPVRSVLKEAGLVITDERRFV